MTQVGKSVFGLTLLLGIAAVLGGCNGYVAEGPDYGPGPGPRYYGEGYYGHDRWYHEGPWLAGPHGYVGDHGGIHPVRGPHPGGGSPGPHPGPASGGHAAPAQSHEPGRR